MELLTIEEVAELTRKTVSTIRCHRPFRGDLSPHHTTASLLRMRNSSSPNSRGVNAICVRPRCTLCRLGSRGSARRGPDRRWSPPVEARCGLGSPVTGPPRGNADVSSSAYERRSGHVCPRRR